MPTTNIEKNQSLTINSFYQKISYQKIQLILEIIKSFLIRELNLNKAFKYLSNELKLFESEKLIAKVYIEIRRAICKFLKLEYQSNPLGEKDSNKFLLADETLINHYKGR